MTVIFLFGTLTASCPALSVDPFSRVARCGQQSCRYTAVTYDTELAAVQVECLPEEILSDGFETQTP
ncbi:MAG: hypothetical protein AAF552_08865 [Pseudomonadota bacterium]